ncbi:MAG: TadE/TadG family type IV pilus assembly protein, partial [Chloroflexota bacterium]
MMLKKNRGQGLTEFALILPVLLLLLLGIIEAGRVIWAYITVQTAAREAARYAIAGRPFLDSNNLTDETAVASICETGAPEPQSYLSGVSPWLCEPTDRTLAIQEVALNRGRTLAISQECKGSVAFDGSCSEQPGAFGVLVRGQVASEVISGTSVTTVISTVVDHPGTQGLNVEVSTFYNIQMITPVFDAIMGGQFLQLQGRVMMQNEGIDAAIGIEPPPGIAPPDPGSDVGTGDESTAYQIRSVSGYENIEPTQELIVHLENHPTGTTYDIYLDDEAGGVYKICSNIPTTAQNRTDPDPHCDLAPHFIPAGSYTLYSTAHDTTLPRLATAGEQVEIISGGAPRIVVAAGRTAAAGTPTEVILALHELGNYNVYLYSSDGATPLGSPIATDVPQNVGPIAWTIPDVGAVCNLDNGPCFVRSYKISDPVNTYADTELYINQPRIVVSPPAPSYAQGIPLEIDLTGHTPHTSYDIYVHGGPTADPLYIGTTPLETDASGDTILPLNWRIPGGCDSPEGWPNGSDYYFTSRPSGGINQIAVSDNFTISTPPDPYLAVVGGNFWPAGSNIKIELHNHEPFSFHYVEFDSQRVPTSSTTDDDTFDTGECGYAVIDYTIPITTPEGTYPIESFLRDGDVFQADLDITVGDVPYITVAEGNLVLPNQTITVQLRNHAASVRYRVVYAEKELFTVRTDGTGDADVSYNLINLPASPGPNFSNPSNLGVFFDMYSQDLISAQHVATTTLAMRGADLAVTRVELPPTVEINQLTPVTVTVQNIAPVSITGYFDIDFYFNPDPIPPSYIDGYNFPGDAKHWQNSVAAFGQPGDTFTFVDEFLVDDYEDQLAYGFADTSNFIFESETSGQAGNENNVDESLPATVRCGTAASTSIDFNEAADLTAWTGQQFGNSHGSASISSERLLLHHTNGTTWDSQDHHFGYYLTNPISSTAGLDIAVKVIQAPNNVQYSKAGISIRNSRTSANSGKIDFGLAAHSSGSAIHHLQTGRRPVGGSTNRIDDVPNVDLETQVRLSNGPVWLRLVRESGSNLVEFYWAQQDARPTPDQWTFYGDTSDVALNNEVYIGLYATNYVSNNNDISTYSDSIFDDFSYAQGDLTDCPPPTEH